MKKKYTKHHLPSDQRDRAAEVARAMSEGGSTYKEIGKALKTEGIHLPGGDMLSSGTIHNLLHRPLKGRQGRRPRRSKPTSNGAGDHGALIALVIDANIPRRKKMAILETLLD